MLVLVAGVIALHRLALSADAAQGGASLQATIDRLAADAKPLLHQATRTREDARDW